MGSTTDSSSDDLNDNPTPVSMQSSHSETSINMNEREAKSPETEQKDGEILTFNVPTWVSLDPQVRLEVLCLAWTLFLYRGSISEEPLSIKVKTSFDATGVEICWADVAEVVGRSNNGVAGVRHKIHHLLKDSMKTQSSSPASIVLSSETSSDRHTVPPFELLVLFQSDAMRIQVRRPPLETTPAMVRIQVEAFIDILTSVSSYPDQTVATAIRVRHSELSQLWAWGSEVPPTLDRSMHEGFCANAREHPDKPAVVSWDGRLTYGELDNLSTNLAAHLSSLGVGPGRAVPLCFEKSAWTVVAVLAIMKAGGTFVLTDPSQPESRLHTIIEEVRADLVLTSVKHGELGQRIAPSATVLVISPDFLDTLKQSAMSSLKAVPGSTTMYIIFTSGSTGKPKGVMLSHANYTSGAIPRAYAVGYRGHTRVLDFASYAFDVSIDCMICTLACGGCICVPSNEQRVNDLSGAIRDMDVNMVHTTPSVARVLDADIIPSLQVLGLGGEALSARDAEKWNSQTTVINAYGPSECTVGCAINNNIARGRSYVSLGRGVGGILWIVNPENHDELSPIGAVGELLVEGPIVGLGYINDPQKTAAVYVEDPAWLVEGSTDQGGRRARLYKTGDLVKYDPDASGCVVFVGRKDQQVKIRGQRVELGEVEHHLSSKLPPQTALAAEVVRRGGTGEPTLVAFIAENAIEGSEEPCFSPELRHTLANIDKVLSKEAPVYMIPSAYIPLKKMPMQVSGKTDRKQLRTIGAAMSRQQLARLRVTSTQHRAPRTEYEKLLAELWSELIAGCEDAGQDDSFFALGGDSLKAMKLVSAARARGVALTVASIFAYPKLHDMAARATKAADQTEDSIEPFSLLQSGWTKQNARAQVAQLCDIDLDNVEDVLPCTPLQEILMAFSAKVSEAYVAQRVLRLADATAARTLRLALEKTVKACPILRTRIVHLPGQGLVQVVVVDDVSICGGDDLKSYINQDQNAPMTLGSRLARFAMIDDTSTGCPHFVFTVHHALYDGWSMPLIVERLNRACAGHETSKGVGFASYIKYLRDMDRSSAETYWRARLGGASNTQFPIRAQPGYQPSADSLLERYVPLHKSSSSTSTTTAAAIRAAWAIVAAEQTGDCDVVFGETLTGRNAPIAGVEQIEGPMITTVPMRVEIDRSMSVASYLQQIHELSVDRIPHEHFGLQNIRKLSPDARGVYDNLFAGLVLHPYDETEKSTSVDGPAAGLVPVDDTEAAREALKFNSYAVMLVCTLDPSGILVMSSFDSSVVPQTEMQHILERLRILVPQLMTSPDRKLSDLMEEVSHVQEPSSSKQAQTKLAAIGGHSNVASERTSSHETTEVVKAMWCRLLDLQPNDVGAKDSFFDLGGDSIAAMKLASELRQAGYVLSVADMFSHRRLTDMAGALQPIQASSEAKHQETTSRSGLLDVVDPSMPLGKHLRLRLAQQEWEVEDVAPTRPLQKIAVDGTTKLPRYSARYELFYFDGQVDEGRLFQSCQQLVDQTEILRTVFMEAEQQCLAVVLKKLPVQVHVYEIDRDVEAFSHQFCNLDVQTRMPLGSAFVKFVFVRCADGSSCLIFRISHAQYDEICLPIMLRQLSALYEGKESEISRPFSTFARHIVQENIPKSKPYWSKLLKGSRMTILAPKTSVQSKLPVAFQKTVNVSQRPKDFTLATFPTAAWALCLARRLGLNDVVFGEVASGRNTGFEGADQVVGPCWQYIPCRVRFEEGWTAFDLLKCVQEQHLSSSEYEGMGLSEIIEHCTDWPRSIDWFDSVVHQDVMHVEQLSFSSASSRMETVYPHLEPLREWKVQAFHHGDKMTLEIVTYESWSEFGQGILTDLMLAFEQLLECSSDRQLLAVE